MKQRTGKKLLTFLLTLAMVVGLMPGMSLTAYAAPTEELLTTITAVGASNAPTATSANVSYSKEDIATLTFSQVTPDGYGRVSYTPTWGWWGYYITITVAPVDGYTITKCVFYDNANHTATDSSSPFVVETTGEEDKTPRVNGSIISDSNCKGIKKIEVYGYATPTHTHSFTYTANGGTITATCSEEGCDLPVVDNKHVATLTIAASGGTYDSSTAYGATITDANSIQGEAKVLYQKKTDGSYGTATETAPTDAGDYMASITVDGATASVEYTIAQADPTANAPTDLTATYGQTLADVSLEGKNPEGNTSGTWAWADSTQSVGNVVTPAATFKATFTPDSSNYKTVENVDVSVTVGKAANPATVTGTATVIKGGNTVDLKDNVTENGATGDVGYEIDGETKGCALKGSVLTSGDTTGTVKVNVTVAADDNYNALAATPITVTISDKGTQTITAEDVTATYGDTDKSVSASVTDPATGGGAISYAVKDGSGDYIDVDASTGALTIKKVPADGKAYVTVTAAGTAAYEQATKDVTVTVNKAESSVAEAPSPTNPAYTGEAQALVTPGRADGGEMYYSTDGSNFSTDVPNGTEVPSGTWSTATRTTTTPSRRR